MPDSRGRFGRLDSSSARNTVEKNLRNFSYTIRKDPAIDQVISNQVAEVSIGILTTCRNAVSLFLLGGYGRGEGSVLVEGKRVYPLGDYDFLLVSGFPPRSVDESTFIPLQNEFHVQYHIGVDTVWRLVLPFLSKRIYWYEAKFGSKFLYGNPRVLGSIPIENGNGINLSEGVSLMSNRLAGLHMVFDPMFVDQKPSEEEKRHLVFQAVKAILACGESLLLLSGRYHFSYEERCRIFSSSFRTDFRMLSESDPGLREDYEKATRFKLDPDFEMYQDPVEFWLRAKNHILSTLSIYVFRVCCGLEASAYDPQDVLSVLMRANEFSIFDFAVFNWNTFKSTRSLKGLGHVRHSPSDVVRGALFLLALSIQDNGEIDEGLLRRTRAQISQIWPMPERTLEGKDAMEKWKWTRDIVISAWNASRK